MHFRLLPAFAISVVVLISGLACIPSSPADIKVFSGVQKGVPEQEFPATASQPPLPQPPAQPNTTNVRQVTITASNSIFSIGIPAGYTEERRVTAQKPINFWFEYLPSDNVSLTVNGSAVEIPVRRSSARLGYQENVTGFSYVIKNQTSQPISYNLHMVPSNTGDSVPAVTSEKWTAP